jgi:hypothetical protein
MTNEVDDKFFTINKLDGATIRRIFTKIKFEKGNQCWLWTGNRNKRGYGRLRFNGPKVRIHRIIYAWLKGPVPKGFGKDIEIIDHICNNRLCCNPDHLRLTTHRINVLRGNGNSAKQARRTHCIRGHLLPPRDFSKHGRFCQPCNTLWAREHYRRIHNLPESRFRLNRIIMPSRDRLKLLD